jgi:hypothetical protein
VGRLSRRATQIIMLSLCTSTATVSAEAAWVRWKHSYEVWVDSYRTDHRSDVSWHRVATTARQVGLREPWVS